jgi:GNAT superfamily N-acetyltransferase
MLGCYRGVASYDLDMADTELRPARAGDGAGLAAIWLEAAAEYAGLDSTTFKVPDTAGLAAWLESQALVDDARVFVSVAERHGQIIGHVWAALVPPGEKAQFQMLRDLSLPRLTVHWLGVRAAHRRQGVGSRLLHAAEDWAISHGARAAGFSTYRDSPAVGFYERRMGYRTTSVFLHKRFR